MNDKQQLQALGESMSESTKPYTREEAMHFLATKVASWPVSSTDGVYYPPEWHRADTAVTCHGWRWIEDSAVWFARDDRSDAISAYEWKMTQTTFEPFVSVEDAQPAPDMVNHPPHYQSDNGIECIDAIRAALGRDGFISYCVGNCMKYLWREKNDRTEDLRKAAWYLDRAIKEQSK